jgi:hypothetical protein
MLFASCALVAQSAAPLPAAPVQGGPPGAILPLPPRDRPQRLQQRPVTGSGSIQGRVRRADTGAPIPRATVFALGQAGPSDAPATTTDDRGVFQFRNLPADKYTVRASKTGFVTMSYGQRSAATTTTTPVELADRQALTGVDVTLPAGAVIEGRIYDEYGEPVAGAIVQTARRRYSNGERRLFADTAITSVTDDLGRFRLYGIAPGARYVSATVNAPTAQARPMLLVGMTGSAAPTYYPGTISAAEALPITVTAGQEVTGIVFQMSSAQVATLSGTVRSASGQSVGPAQLMLSAFGSSRSGIVRPDGTFTFANLAPGPYTVIVRLNDLSEVAYVPVTLAGADVALSIATRPGATIRGRFVFDGGAPPTGLAPENMSVTVQAVESALTPLVTGSAKTSDDWTFELPGVVGAGVLRFSTSPRSTSEPDPWRLKAVLRGGVDITDTPMAFTSDVDDVEMVITQRVTVITGTLTGEKTDSPRDVTVVVFADDPQRWGPRSRYVLGTRPDASGKFTLRGLPPGRYLAIAVDDLEPGDEQDPDILETFRRKASPLTLREGESKTLELTVTRD